MLLLTRLEIDVLKRVSHTRNMSCTTTVDIAEIAEDFRLYCLSFWPDLYLIYFEWFNAKTVTWLMRRAWYD